MADSVNRTIYKLEIDDSAYIKGIDSVSASTSKFSQKQDEANKKLQENQAQLDKQREILAKSKKALEDYTGSDEKHRQQLSKSFEQEKKAYETIQNLVGNVRKSYEAAKAQAESFNATAAKAANLPPGKLTGPAPIIPAAIPQAFKDFDINDILSQAAPNFEKLRDAVASAETHLASLNKEGQEFKELSPIVDKAKTALQQYDAITESTATSTLSLRSQIRQGRDELVRMEEAGKGTSREYIELEKRVARLTDAFGDQQQRIRILASDTKALDFGKAAITAATSAFQSFTAVQVLVGEGSEELQKKTLQLFAAMQLLTSLEQISNLVRREGTLATLAQSAAQSIYTVVVGASTGALKAFRIALLATGIGAAVAVIGILVAKYIQYRNAIKEASEDQKLLNTVNEKAVEGYAKEVAQLEVLRLKLTDSNTPQKERIRLAKEYNKTADEGNKLDLKQIENIDNINAAIDRQIGKIKERALAQAAAAVTEEAATKLFKAEQSLSEVNDKFVLDLTRVEDQIKEVSDAYNTAAINFALSGKQADQQTSILLGKTLRGLQDVKKANDDFTRAARLTATLPGGSTDKPKPDPKQIENEFLRRKADLDARLAALARQEADNEVKIRAEFASRLAKEQLEIEKAFREKRLTAKQKGILTAELVQINELELNKALADFNKKVTDARKKLNDELDDLQKKNTEDQLNLIQDEFQRRAALIEFNEKQELEDQQKNTEERLAALDLDRLLIGEQAFQDAKAQIIDEGERAALNIQRRYNLERQNLAADTFKKILQAYENAISTADLIRDEAVAQQIRNVSNRFLAGTISFKTFQDEITKIQKEAEATRRNATLQTQRNELSELDRHIEQVKDKTSQEYKDLLKLRDELRAKIAAGEKEDAVKDAEEGETTKTEDPRIAKLIAYSEAIGQVADSVIQFWQKANEAETKALDRSIALQEKRVDAARRIAERGNAEYLRQEEDRLNELNIQRENAARRQLAIDAALQASQLLVGITGAIAKIASGIGAAETIAEIAIIVGALATGYGLVKSLQGNQPRLAEGELYVRRGKNPAGVDTIPAWLNEGEAVMPADKNRQYHPAIKAIYNGSIPADHMNEFVKNYPQIKSVPQLNHERIKQATELHISHDGKLAVAISDQNKLLAENNDLQRQTVRAIRSIKNEVTLDRNGFAASFMEVVEQWEKEKRT